MTHQVSSEFIHHSIKEFRIIYGKLIIMGLSQDQICVSSNLAYATVNILLKDQVPRVRASTIGKLQEFIKKYNTQTLTNRKFQEFIRTGEHVTVSIPEGTKKDYASRAGDIVKESGVPTEDKIKGLELEKFLKEITNENARFFMILRLLYQEKLDGVKITITFNGS